MPNPFMTLKHCASMAIRQSLRSGDVVHVVATGNDDYPLDILDEHELFARGNRLGPEDVVFTADPFLVAETG